MNLSDYYKTISAMGKEAQRAKRAAGEAMNLAPLGFRKVRKDGRLVLEPDPASWSPVSEARTLRQLGFSIRHICRSMEARGLRSQRGKVIGPSSMLLILKRYS